MELGTFTKDENGIIAGIATTLLTSFEIEYRKIEKVGNGPDFRVYRRGTDIEVGFAHAKFGNTSGKPYLNTLIDTPEFPQGIWVALVGEEDGTYIMKWSRPRKKKGANAEAATSQTSSAVDAF